MNYLSICCIARNEHHYIQEWVDYHLMAGAEKIIIYDNESVPPLKEKLRKEPKQEKVIIIPAKGREAQIPAYNHCLQEFGPESKWIAFIDADEVLFPKKQDDLRLVLADYEQHGGLGVHWVEYGSSGHLAQPVGGQVESYLHRFPLEYPKNMHIKSIVQPEKVEKAFNPHQLVYKKPWYCVDEDHFPLAESWGPFTNEKIQLNHYYFRSQQDFCQKIQRGRADRIDEAGARKLQSFYPQTTKADVFDDSLSGFYSKLKSGKKDYISRLIPADNNNKDQEKNNLVQKILIFISKNKTRLARKMISAARAVLIDKYTLNYLLIRILQKEGRFVEAEQIFQELLTESPDPHTYLDFADNLILAGKYLQADKIYTYIKWCYAGDIKKNSNLRDRMRYNSALLDSKHSQNLVSAPE